MNRKKIPMKHNNNPNLKIGFLRWVNPSGTERRRQQSQAPKQDLRSNQRGAEQAKKRGNADPTWEEDWDFEARLEA
jgi:hypothetical protein